MFSAKTVTYFPFNCCSMGSNVCNCKVCFYTEMMNGKGDYLNKMDVKTPHEFTFFITHLCCSVYLAFFIQM